MTTTTNESREAITQEACFASMEPVAFDKDKAYALALENWNCGGWDLTPDDLIRLSYVHGADGNGRVNGFDDKPEDVVYRSPSGGEMSRAMVSHWYNDWCSFSHGFVVALRVSATQLATVEARIRELEEQHACTIDILEQTRRQRDALESALAAAKLGGEWQPIETAPKDGTHILAVDITGACGVIWWNEKEGMFEDLQCLLENDGVVTHWIPLPAAPKKEDD